MVGSGPGPDRTPPPQATLVLIFWKVSCDVSQELQDLHRLHQTPVTRV